MRGLIEPISYKKKPISIDFKNQIKSYRAKYDLASLKRKLAIIDGSDIQMRIPLGIHSLDQALSGGLAFGRVHLLSGSMQTHGAVSGFAMALIELLQDYRSKQKQLFYLESKEDTGLIIWCPESLCGGAGMLYGHGIANSGLDPEQFLILDIPNTSRRLAALDDILCTKDLSTVVVEYGELQKSTDYWMRLTRRLQLAAKKSRTTVLFLGAPIVASGFETVWEINPSLDLNIRSNPEIIWHSVWDLNLKRVRGGWPHRCRVRWQTNDKKFQPLESTDVNLTMPKQIAPVDQRSKCTFGK